MRPGRVGDAPAGAAAAEVDVAVGARAARVRGRAQLAQQAQLLERGLELRAEDAPLDPLERAERRLDRRPLPLGAEVRPQPCPQVARAADVEHLVVPVAEEVDAGRGGAPATSERLPARRRARGAESSTSSATVSAPRSCASPISASRISAVASASASARWHGRVDVPKK